MNDVVTLAGGSIHPANAINHTHVSPITRAECVRRYEWDGNSQYLRKNSNSRVSTTTAPKPGRVPNSFAALWSIRANYKRDMKNIKNKKNRRKNVMDLRFLSRWRPN